MTEQKKTSAALTERDGLVDLFKGIAMLMVIFVHAAQSFHLNGALEKIPQVGQMGCQIFFVLSAYTICLSLERRYGGFGLYLKKRLFRIAPEYWLTMLLYAVLAGVSVLVLGRNIIGNHLSVVGTAANALFLHGLIPIETVNNRVVRGGWFVGTLILFYLVAPAAFRLFEHPGERWRKVRKILFPAVVCAVGSAAVLLIGSLSESLKIENNSFLYFSLLNQAGCFALGYSLYALVKERKTVRLPLVKSLAALAGSVILFYTDKIEAVSCLIFPMLFGVSFVYLYMFGRQNGFLSGNRMPQRILSAFGRNSYAIYLMHTFVVYDAVYLGKKVLTHLGIGIAEPLLFCIVLPFLIAAAFFLGKLFDTAVRRIRKLIKI